jgi:alpha-tubulin suppressor-like RCC1 family protein
MTKYCGSSGCVGVKQIVAGYNFTCALMTDQTVRCWGANDFQQLGQGASTTQHLTPVTVPGLTGVVKLASTSSEGYRVCALLGDQTAKCWGNGNLGTLGDGITTEHATGTPTPVLKSAGVPFTGIKEIATGQNITCLLDTAGTPWCWGHQLFGGVGDGVLADTSRALPVAVTFPSMVDGMSGSSSIAVGRWHACVTATSTTTAGVRCWGDNAALGLGVTGATSFASAQAVTGLTSANGSLPNSVGAGSPQNVSCAILNTSTLGCWGGNSRGQLGRDTIGPATNAASYAEVCRAGCTSKINLVTSFGIGEQFSCAVTNKAVRCWGRDNGYGSLGDGTSRPSTSPVLTASIGPALPTDALEVAVGSYHACARLADASVQCWGWGTSGQLGNGLTANSALPVAVQF